MEGIVGLCGEDALAPDFYSVDGRVEILHLSLLEHAFLTDLIKPETVSYSRQDLVLPAFQNHRNSLNFSLMHELELAPVSDPLIDFQLRFF